MKVWDKVRKKKTGASSKRITNDTIDEHREEILAKGRKFKYPFQYAKYKLVVNAIIIGVVAVISLLALGWLELYRFQNMSDIMYRFTKVIPVPVAKIADEDVRYSDFLMIYRSSIAAIEAQQGKLGDTDEDKMLKEQYKRQALDAAVEYTYALKLARELNIEVTKDEILEAEKEHRIVDGVERSEESFANIIETNFGLSVQEYERLLRLSLTKKAVAVKVDEGAKKTVSEIQAKVEAEMSFADIVTELGDKVIFEETGGYVDNLNLDGGRADAASKLERYQVSEAFVSKSGDGYYFVKLIEKTDMQVNYASLKVPLTEFGERLSGAKEKELSEYIEIGVGTEEE